MQRTPVIAIFDIGKTNKKCFLFDAHYRLLKEQSVKFTELPDEDGHGAEDLGALSAWVTNTFHVLQQLGEYDIRAVNFSGYGASFVWLDQNGQPIAPLYSYLKPYPAALQQQFYDQYGPAHQVARDTASPALGSLNSGMQLYRLKYEQPATFARTRYCLHLPQYLSFLLTGQAYADITSIGCHTQLWDFTKNAYHDWVAAEGILPKLPPLHPAENAVAAVVNGRPLQAGIGLHDSSAALIPYLSGFQEPFVLLSTGTWCISLNPFNHSPLTNEELQNDCLCYLDYKGRPVKASRVFAGYAHEQLVKKLASHFNKPLHYYREVWYDPAMAATLRPEPLQDLGLPSLDPFSGYESAYHQWMVSILEVQRKALERVLHGTPVKRIFVDGGFSGNPVFMHLLAAAFPQVEVYAAAMAQASALGAALAIHHAWNAAPMPTDLIDLKYYAAPQTV
ncbi:Sugar (pentulose or hexulose) kinase [Chitinophaga costaii]|uniref:Sugar (Pentulose or hexulose) kinase n=1 Tax=Chitinophaga costaii TaxID=1335309 RepID=A0A1C4C8E3_9BACT|nr:FGGY family carbohydrate kinase [Chitinophaga costaii]PUZ27194.1 carbohydrate kinase [Chitinophaga costaii]SCC15312.1 Sugar (pentulose or hexulose) kinase [Chitinophaga costaii]